MSLYFSISFGSLISILPSSPSPPLKMAAFAYQWANSTFIQCWVWFWYLCIFWELMSLLVWRFRDILPRLWNNSTINIITINIITLLWRDKRSTSSLARTVQILGSPWTISISPKYEPRTKDLNTKSVCSNNKSTFPFVMKNTIYYNMINKYCHKEDLPNYR